MTANFEFELPTPELLKVLADNWATNTLKAFPDIATPEQFRSALGIKESTGDPGHAHGPYGAYDMLPMIPEVMFAYIAGIRMDAETRTYWHQWYHQLSLSDKYRVDAFRMKWESDQVKANQPQHTMTLSDIAYPATSLVVGVDVALTGIPNAVAYKAQCINDQLKWTPVMAEDTDKPKTPETKEQYEERRNKRIADRIAADMLADANKKLKAKEDTPERHWSDHRPWPGAHGSQYMLRF